MSYERGMSVLQCKSNQIIGHTEYCSNYALIRAVTGLEPAKNAEAYTKFNDAWGIDFCWSTNDGPQNWGQLGRATDMGHAEFLENGADKRETRKCPFKDVDDVLKFDAVEEYGLPNFDELVQYYEHQHHQDQQSFPRQVYTSGYYKTLVSGAIDIFGWDMLLEAASYQDEFDTLLESIFQQTLFHVQAWAKTTAPVFIQHDDMVWSQGAFMHPDFYRKAIFPRYKKLWEILHDAGKIVLFCSDGNFTEFIDDIASAGADGFIFEPMTSLEYIVEKYGDSKAIIGSKSDCRTLTFGSAEQIRWEIDETMKIVKGCAGFMYAVGNHIPSNVPVDNALIYFDHLNQYRLD